MKKLTVAVCTYNRAQNLRKLVEYLRNQVSSETYDILFIDNNSSDNTLQVLEELASQPGAELRIITESKQGIPFARNRALEESMESDFLLFMDDDELPSSRNMIEIAATELKKGTVQCVGGKVTVNFADNIRPKWLIDELLGFYAEIDHGDKPFLICDESTPIWTSIIAYNMDIFRDNKKLRFDVRYNRTANGIGGGSDAIMFTEMLNHGIKMMYLPDMAIDHFVEPWRMSRRYFWKLHFIAGRKYGQFETPNYEKTLLGIPPFMIKQFFSHLLKSLYLFIKKDNYFVRQGMNMSHSLGMIYGRYLKNKDGSY